MHLRSRLVPDGSRPCRSHLQPGSSSSRSIHHALMCLLFSRIYTFSVPGTRHFLWYPLGNLVVDLILVRAIQMCLTGNVTWRGTHYQRTSKN